MNHWINYSVIRLHLWMLFLVFHSSACASVWNEKIMDVESRSMLTLSDLGERLRGSEWVVMGEKHDTLPIQLAQSKVMETVLSIRKEVPFTTAWEFLNRGSQSETDSAYERFLRGETTVFDFLDFTQGTGKNRSYAPVLEVTKKFGGKLLGINLSRKDKDPVVMGGLSSAKPGTIPPDFEMGGAFYYERFVKAMEGHATPAQIQNYFAAQCLTDETMAFHLLRDAVNPIRFVILGGFHTDYFDGTVASLYRRKAGLNLTLIRFLDASDYSESELKDLLIDTRYGRIADFVYFVNEPK